MSVTICIEFAGEDFERFINTYNSRESSRVTAGLSTTAYRNQDNANQAVVIGTAPSKEAFTTFVSSPEQQEAMKGAGIQGPPSITFLEEA